MNRTPETNRLARRFSFFVLVLVCIADPAYAQEALFPSATVPGFSRILEGEDFAYHSPLRARDRSLLVRSLNREYSIAWESAEIPADVSGDEITFVVMAAIDVRKAPETFAFDLFIEGKHALTFRNPESIAGDNLVWPGIIGVSARFRVSELDRYGDAMGWLFISVPRRLIHGNGPVRFEVKGESAEDPAWFMVFQEIVRPHISLRNAPALLRGDAGESQTLRADVLYFGEDGAAFVETETEKRQIPLRFGLNRISVQVPSVVSRSQTPVNFRIGSLETTIRFEVEPVRQMDIYLLHHTHVDIGYTHHQDDVEQIQWDNLESALMLGERSAEYPENARFVWNPESIWALDTYLTNFPDKAERMLEGIREGWIEPDGLYGNIMTGLASGEALMRSLEASQRIAERSGVPILSEMQSDIPGYTWGLVPVLAQHGIRYFSIGPNFGHRIGHFMDELADKPFYWESPSGKDRILTWISGGGYAWFHTGLGYDSMKNLLTDDNIFAYVDQLAEQEYPYDMSYLRYNIGSDNGPTDPGLSDMVRDWNEKYASPRLIISGTTGMFEEFERRYGSELPTVRGDMTGYWEDGAASSALETSRVRRAAESLVQTEALAAILDVDAPDEIISEAWRNATLYYEHTWGSWDSISDPESEFTRSQWRRKKEFADTADGLAQKSRRDVLASFGSGQGDFGSFDVVNTLNWMRSGLVVVPEEAAEHGDRVATSSGEPIPTQRLYSGELVIVARDVPAFGSLRFVVRPGDSPADASSGGAIPNIQILENADFVVEFDSTNGSIRSLRFKPMDFDLVDGAQSAGSQRADTRGAGSQGAGSQGAGTRGAGSQGRIAHGAGLNEYLYVADRNPENVHRAENPVALVKEWGDVVRAFEVRSDAPGADSPLATEVRLIRGKKSVEIINRIDKSWTYDPEAVLYRFPFNVSDPSVRIDIPWGSYEPEAGQIRGSSKNYFSVQRWVDLSESDRGVTVTTIDAPIIELGEIRTDAVVTGWLDRAEPSSALYSYVMNNYWETNFRAAQDGWHTFRYSIRPHDGFDGSKAERFAREETQPLISFASNVGHPDTAVPFQIESERAVVTLMRRADQAGAFIVRLYNPGEIEDEVSIVTSDGSGVDVFESDVRNRKGEYAGARFTLLSYEIKTLWIERSH